MDRYTILITGATGNVGQPLIRQLLTLAGNRNRILAGVRRPFEKREAFPAPDVEIVGFDFGDPETFRVLREVDRLFLLRPPQLADVKRYFAPLIDASVRAGAGHIVFLSVQGAESRSWIPHHKIEQLIHRSGIAYTFLRPAYFMQNFTGDLCAGIRRHNRIFLPAGNAAFNLIDARDIARVAAEVLLHPEAFHKEAFDVTGPENMTFGEMAEILSEELGRPIRYESPGPLQFGWRSWREGTPPAKALVMTLLHFLPRFGKAPRKNQDLWRKLDIAPRSFRAFVREHRKVWMT